MYKEQPYIFLDNGGLAIEASKIKNADRNQCHLFIYIKNITLEKNRMNIFYILFNQRQIHITQQLIDNIHLTDSWTTEVNKSTKIKLFLLGQGHNIQHKAENLDRKSRSSKVKTFTISCASTITDDLAKIQKNTE